MANSHKRNGVSLAKGPAGLLGLAMIAFGVLSYLMGADSFTADPFRGTVNGDTFLGLEANGWTSLLWAGSGLLLLLAAPLHWGAKTVSLAIAFVLGACALLWVADRGGTDALGIFAANGLTATVWAIVAGALAVIALLPRVGRKDHADHDDHDRVVDRSHHRARTVDVDRDGVDDRDEHRTRVTGRDGRFDRDDDRTRITDDVRTTGTPGATSASRRDR